MYYICKHYRFPLTKYRFTEAFTKFMVPLSAVEPGETLFNSSDNKFDLQQYYQYRPLYTKSFYKLVLGYHESHGGQWEVIHDVGAGGGNVAEETWPTF